MARPSDPGDVFMQGASGDIWDLSRRGLLAGDGVKRIDANGRRAQLAVQRHGIYNRFNWM